MYDFSGEWVYRVGMPAKSGVGGGIMAVLPGQLGIGVYSPTRRPGRRPLPAGARRGQRDGQTAVRLTAEVTALEA